MRINNLQKPIKTITETTKQIQTFEEISHLEVRINKYACFENNLSVMTSYDMWTVVLVDLHEHWKLPMR